MDKYIYDGKEYDSIQHYYNSDDLDTDLIYVYLWRGVRQPQNEKEKRWQEESEEITKNRGSFELSFN